MTIQEIRTVSDEDKKILYAIETYMKRFSEDDFDDVFDTLKRCNFENHICGRGGNHIWIKNKNTDTRIFIILN